jgi:hypothetical protein
MTDQNSTPSSNWREAGEADPHAGRYDGERSTLALGHITDDALANGVYLNGNAQLDIKAVMSKDPDYFAPIAWLTAGKDRIRWLSRSLENCLEALKKMTADRDERLKNNLNLRLRNDLLEERLKLATDLLNDISRSDPSRALDNRVDAFAQLPDITAKTE